MTIDLSNKEQFDMRHVRKILPHKDITPLQIDQVLVPYMNKFYASLTNSSIAAYAQILHKSLNMENEVRVERYTTKAMLQSFQNKTYREQKPNQPGKYKKLRNILQMWLSSPKREDVDECFFCPYPKTHALYPKHNLFLNSYLGLPYEKEPCPPPHPGHKEKLAFYFDHLFQYLCGGNPTYAEYIHQYMAAKIQMPWEKIGTSIILTSREGAGKGVFLEPWLQLFGKYATQVSDLDPICQRFNSLTDEKLMLFVDELSTQSNTSKIKALITEKKTTIEKKYEERQQKTNFCDIIFATNEDYPIRQDGHSRRYFIMEVSNLRGQRASQQHFKRMALLQQDTQFLSSLYHHLLEYPVDRDMLRNNPPYTPKLQYCIIQEMDRAQYFLYKSLQKGGLYIRETERKTPQEQWPSSITIEELLSLTSRHTKLQQFSGKRKTLSEEHIKATWLKLLGTCCQLKEKSYGQTPNSRVEYFNLQSFQECRSNYVDQTGIRFDIEFITGPVYHVNETTATFQETGPSPSKKRKRDLLPTTEEEFNWFSSPPSQKPLEEFSLGKLLLFDDDDEQEDEKADQLFTSIVKNKGYANFN